MARIPKPNPPEEPTPGLVPGAGFQPADVLFITSPEMLKAVSDPLRLDILELVRVKALTVKQIAGKLGEPPTRLYYHVAALEEAGFVTQVDTRIKSGIVEKYYRASAENITVERKLLNASDQPSEMLSALLSSVFDSTVEDLVRSFGAGLILPAEKQPAAIERPLPAVEQPAAGETPGPEGAPEGAQAAPLVLTRSLVRLPRAKAAEFAEKFNDLLKELDAEDKAQDEAAGRQSGASSQAQSEGMSYGVTVAFYPRLPAGPGRTGGETAENPAAKPPVPPPDEGSEDRPGGPPA